MKTYNNLWENFISFENLYKASLKAQRGKRWKESTLEFNFNKEQNLLKLKRQLETGKWKPGKYFAFTIQEPKERIIHAAPYIDRVVHHALINIIEPIWESRFYDHSYACRKGKGTHKAVNTCQQYLRKYKYVLKCDIRKYFPSIDREILKNIIHKKISDKQLLIIIDYIIDSSPEFEEIIEQSIRNENQLSLFKINKNKKGIPIGNLTSQFFANVYLNELDQWLKRECKIKGYIRYMDDFLIFANEKPRLHYIKKELKEFLQNKLELTLHPKKAEVFPIKNRIPFLGYHVYRYQKRLQKNNIKRFIKRMKVKQCEFSKSKIDMKQITQSIHAWIGHSSHADTNKLRESIFSNLVFVRNN